MSTLNDDTIVELCRHVEAKPSLAALARTSRGFFQPATNELWKSPITLADILKTLGPDLFQYTTAHLYDACAIVQAAEESTPTGGSRNSTFGVSQKVKSTHTLAQRWGFVRAPEPNDWSRFNIYSSKVTTMTTDGSSEIHSSVIRVLALHRPRHSLIPKLRKLTWQSPSAWLTGITLFIHQPLHSITVMYHDASVVRSILATTVHNVPEMKSLSIGHLDNVAISSNEVMKHITLLTHLEHIRLGDPFSSTTANHTLLCLASMRHLQTVSIALQIDAVLPASLHPNAFPTLHTFEIRASIGLCDRIVELIKPTRPPSFIIHIEGAVSDSNLSNLFTTLRDSHGTTLQTLTVDYRSASVLNVTRDIARALLDISGLKKVEFGGGCVWMVQDEDIDGLCKCWPELTEISMPVNDRPQVALTWDGLMRLVAGCPKLTTVTIGVNPIPIPSCIVDTSPVYPQLRSLCLSGGVILSNATVPDLTRFLSFVFPNVILKTASNRAWSLVEQFLPTLQKTRREERFRWEVGGRVSY